MNDEEYAIKVDGLTKVFGTTRAVDNLSFAVEPGVICGFVGPNGSGKTTTMRILATLLRQDRGRAMVFGMNTAQESSARKVRHAIGFMPDYFGLYSDMTATEYLDFFAAAYRIPIAERPVLVNDILDLVGLRAKADTLIAGLSRGMQQRLSLGRCLVHSPRLLLLDEPASGLDPRARIELMELLRELKRMGKTILISSHILSELGTLCDTVVIIEHGQLVYAGSLDDASRNMHQGHSFIELLVEHDGEAVSQALAVAGAIPGVLGVRSQDHLVYVEYADDTTSADIIGACVAGGIRIMEARRGQARLEEIFMSLTKGEIV